MIKRTYSELILLPSFEERFEYLKLGAAVGEETFGWDRYINQMFYSSVEWRRVRDEIIARDRGCDLGALDHEIYDRVIIHHMNPITESDIALSTEFLMDPEYLITTSHNTHNAIHYGVSPTIKTIIVERTPNDTCPWKGVLNERKHS